MIKNFLKGFVYLVLALILFFNLAVWINVRSPLNAVFTMPKILYPNILFPALIFYLSIIGGMLTFCFFKRSLFKRTFVIITFIFLSFFTINTTVLFLQINASPSTVEESDVRLKMEIGELQVYNRSDFKLDKLPEISNLSLFVPNQSEKSKTLFLYLPYGNWSVHSDLAMFDHLKNTILKKGYSYGYLSSSGRKKSNIFQIVSELKRGIQLIQQDERFFFERIIISGGSAGGHIALLLAYSENQPKFDHYKTDITVDGVAAFYSPTDMFANYEKYVTNAGEQWGDKLGDLIFSTQDQFDSVKESHIDAMNDLLGGSPENNNENYELTSVQFLIHQKIPKTLFVHGKHDSMTPYTPPKNLYAELKEKGYDVDFITLNYTDHAFDTIFPKFSQPTRIAYSGLINWLETF